MNNIQLITKYSTKAWDKIYKAESRIAILDGQDGVNVQWTGAKTVKIAKFQAGGLKNYYRNNNGDDRVTPPAGAPFGYQQSSVGLTWQERTVRMDRAAYYPIELFDNEETDGLTLGAATTEVSRTIIIPEVDAYGFSEIAENCSADLGNYVKTEVSKTNAVEKLNDALLYFDNNEVPAEDQVIFVSPRYFNYLRNDNTELNRFLMQADFKKDISYTVTSYEGRQLVVVPPQRFRTKFTVNTQTGEGYGFGGWDATANDGAGAAIVSEDINFIVCAKSAVMHVVKYNKVKILSGDIVLAMGFDGYALFARVYHDLFVLDNKKYAIYTCVQDGTDKLSVTAATSSTAVKEVKTGKNSKLDNQ